MPHVCGDEPVITALTALLAAVCPTYVGMNRMTQREMFEMLRMPHVCGDEPIVTMEIEWLSSVCPTYVGMNRFVRTNSR